MFIAYPDGSKERGKTKSAVATEAPVNSPVANLIRRSTSF
jgi:hypothetical protein